MAKRIDWEQVESDYRAGQLSVRALATKHDVSDTAIRKRAKKGLWERDLAEKVQRRVRSELVRGKSSQFAVRTNEDPYSEESIIAAAAATGVEVVRSHRTAIAALRVVSNRYTELLSEQVEAGTRTVESKDGALEIDVDLEYVGKCLGYGSGALQKLTAMERQAFNLDIKEEAGGNREVESVLDLVMAQKDGLMPVE